MGISSVESGLRPGVCTSTTRPVSPYIGQIIFETDTANLKFWGGSVWQNISVAQTGTIDIYAGLTAPSGWLFCYGQAISRTTYPDLFNVLSPSQGTVTMTIASPCVVTQTGHPFFTGDGLYLSSTGALPTGLAVNTRYFAIRVDANTYRLATSRANAVAGTAINTSGSQSGTHTAFANPHGLGDGTTTFNVPDLRGYVVAGRDNMGDTPATSSSANRLTNPAATTGGLDGRTLGNTGGSETHVLTTAQLAAHQHYTGAAFDDNATQGPYPYYFRTGGGSTRLPPPNGMTSDNQGSGNAHNNVQPTMIMNYIIKV